MMLMVSYPAGEPGPFHLASGQASERMNGKTQASLISRLRCGTVTSSAFSQSKQVPGLAQVQYQDNGLHLLMGSHVVKGVVKGRGEELQPFWQSTSPHKKAWHVQRPEDN